MWATPSGPSGLRIRGERGHPVVRRALIRFAVYLRGRYEFPVRLPVYLSSRERLLTPCGEGASAAFWCPDDPDGKPSIRIATGDYPSWRAEIGNRDDALAGFLGSLAHEVIHYFQWLETGDTTERGVEVRATGMVRDYARTVAHP